MPSPFPGMDPWLERPMVFPTLHNNLITYLQAALKPILPKGYIAAGANRVYIDPDLKREPDVGVFGPNDVPRGRGGTASALANAGLLIIPADPVAEPVEEPYLEILSAEDDRLVTAIEVVSLSNKRHGDAGRASYQQKQGEYRASGVNLVEIDLLRRGPHTTAVPETKLRAAAPAFDYHVCVSTAEAPGEFYVAPIKLADRLPTIPIPLDPGVPLVSLDLQAVFDRCYDEGPLSDLARYDRRRPDPTLTPEQQAWAEGILRGKGLLK
jgi:hypothetical protein